MKVAIRVFIHPGVTMSMIYDNQGRRKYLTLSERDRFCRAAMKLPRDERTFCLTIAFSGCRISEALQLTGNRIDLEERVLIIRTLKKRRNDMFRVVPMPEWVLDLIQTHIGSIEGQSERLLWPWSRAKGWMVIKRVMADAGVAGGHACPKGLRHAFGIAAIQRGIPLNLIQKWLGHSKIETTAIYTNAMGDEERLIAERMWTPITALTP